MNTVRTNPLLYSSAFLGQNSTGIHHARLLLRARARTHTQRPDTHSHTHTHTQRETRHTFTHTHTRTPPQPRQVPPGARPAHQPGGQRRGLQLRLRDGGRGGPPGGAPQQGPHGHCRCAWSCVCRGDERAFGGCRAQASCRVAPAPRLGQLATHGANRRPFLRRPQARRSRPTSRRWGRWCCPSASSCFLRPTSWRARCGCLGGGSRLRDG